MENYGRHIKSCGARQFDSGGLGTRRGQALAGVIALGRNWKADLFAVGEAKMCGGEDKAIEGETVCVRED